MGTVRGGWRHVGGGRRHSRRSSGISHFLALMGARRAGRSRCRRHAGTRAQGIAGAGQARSYWGRGPTTGGQRAKAWSIDLGPIDQLRENARGRRTIRLPVDALASAASLPRRSMGLARRQRQAVSTVCVGCQVGRDTCLEPSLRRSDASTSNVVACCGGSRARRNAFGGRYVRYWLSDWVGAPTQAGCSWDALASARTFATTYENLALRARDLMAICDPVATVAPLRQRVGRRCPFCRRHLFLVRRCCQRVFVVMAIIRSLEPFELCISGAGLRCRLSNGAGAICPPSLAHATELWTLRKLGVVNHRLIPSDEGVYSSWRLRFESRGHKQPATRRVSRQRAVAEGLEPAGGNTL
jgi:hypothetical protein